jgi:hypothetical protein
MKKHDMVRLTTAGREACVDAILEGRLLSEEERRSISGAMGEVAPGEVELVLLAGVTRWFERHAGKELTFDEKNLAVIMGLFKLHLEAGVRRRQN